jgi:hypothetical protein
MDYIFLSSIINTAPLPVVLSYDIMCQWKKNLWHRLPNLPESLRSNATKDKLIGVIPKFHIMAHEEICQLDYSLHYTPGVGRTDGEGIERNWASLNGAAPSTKEMGPGARRDTLDDFCNFSNHKKVLAFGELSHSLLYKEADFNVGNTLLRRMLECIPEATVHRMTFMEFDDGLRRERPDQLREWEEMLEEWNKDHSKPCPYADSRTSK